MDKIKKYLSEDQNINTLLIKDEDGNVIIKFQNGKLTESEDGVMTYFTGYPYRNKGVRCPFCGKNINLRK